MPELRLGTLNKVLLIGRLTREPELRNTQSSKLLKFGLAVNRRYRDNTGEWRDDTTFVNVVAWNKTAEHVVDRLGKGTAVMVEGRLQSRSWETDDGSKRSTIEVNAMSIQVLEKMGASSGPPEPTDPAYHQNPAIASASAVPPPGPPVDEDEIPF